jgi:hypothetical protein
MGSCHRQKRRRRKPMQAGGINLFGMVADCIDRERLNQTDQSNCDAFGSLQQSLRIPGATRSERTLSGRRD